MEKDPKEKLEEEQKKLEQTAQKIFYRCRLTNENAVFPQLSTDVGLRDEAEVKITNQLRAISL